MNVSIDVMLGSLYPRPYLHYIVFIPVNPSIWKKYVYVIPSNWRAQMENI